MKKELLLLKALADETRFKIVRFLLDGEKCACEIHPHVKRAQPTVSLQLKKLEKAGVVKSRKVGRKVLYSIKNYTVCDVFKALGISPEKNLKNSCDVKVKK